MAVAGRRFLHAYVKFKRREFFSRFFNVILKTPVVRRAYYQNNVLNAGLNRFFKSVLDQRLAVDFKKVFGGFLGERHKPFAETGNRQNQFGDFRHWIFEKL